MVSLVDIVRRAGKELYKHQLDFVSDALLTPRPRMLLADDVGLGKTIQALLLIKALLEMGRVNNILVVVPRAVLGQWMAELERFEIPYYYVESPSLAIGYRVYITTLDRAKKSEYLDALDKISWDLVVVDEAHKIRLETQRERLAFLCKKAGGCLLLTATPHTGDHEDYEFLASLVEWQVIRREKKDVEEYEGRKIFPSLGYWVVQVEASKEESIALMHILKILEREKVEPIVRVVVEKRAMSSPASFLSTLSKVVGGQCDWETLEEGELDACLGNVAGWKELQDLASKFASASDRKLQALLRLVEHLRGGGWNKSLVFTEYATTAEYVFDSLVKEYGCAVVESADGYARADCGRVGVMYATSKARERIDVGQVANLLAGSHETAVFISTDIMSEGVNLQAYNVVVNYEVVWSPTKHVQRVGRIWRFGQTAPKVLVVDMLLKTRLERDEYTMYLDLLEKLYDISLRALPPQSYGEFVIYELSEDQLKKILEVGSLIDLKEAEMYSAKLDELKRRIERILEAREQMKWKPKWLVDEGLSAKLGYPYGKGPEPGGGYYVVNVQYSASGKPLYTEQVLVRLSSPLSRSREVQEGVFREGAVDWDRVQLEGGNIRDDEEAAISEKVQVQIWMPLKRYVEKAKKYVRIGEGLNRKIVSITRARVIGVEVRPGDEFEDIVRREVRRSENIARTEQAAVRCAEMWLRNNGYVVETGYFSGPRPFDLVVKKGGVIYVVEIKGKWIRLRDDPISFTANEIDFASRFPARYIVCVAYVEGDNCDEVICMPFSEFQKEWILETVRGLEYKYNARRKTSGTQLV